MAQSDSSRALRRVSKPDFRAKRIISHPRVVFHLPRHNCSGAPISTTHRQGYLTESHDVPNAFNFRSGRPCRSRWVECGCRRETRHDTYQVDSGCVAETHRTGYHIFITNNYQMEDDRCDKFHCTRIAGNDTTLEHFWILERAIGLAS